MSDITRIVEALQDKSQEASDAQKQLYNTRYEIDDAISDLQAYIDEVETLISNFESLPEISVEVVTDVSFDSTD